MQFFRQVEGPSEQGNNAPPGRVLAAMDCVRFFHDVTNPHSYEAGAQLSPRDLSKKEQATLDSALECLRLYFSGEMDYGDPAPSDRWNHGGDDDGESLVPVEVG